MLRWMLRVDSWFDVASLENMEEDHNFLFLKKNLVKIFFWTFDFFFFLKYLEILNFLKELKILIDVFFFFWKIWKSWIFSRNWKFWLIFFFFESNLRSTSPMPLVPRPFLKIYFFFFFFFFFFFLGEIWRFVHYQKVKKIKLE